MDSDDHKTEDRVQVQVPVRGAEAAAAIRATTMNGSDGDWKSQLDAGGHQAIIDKIVGTLRNHLPFCGEEELKKIAVRFEEKVYNTASSQLEYLRKISLKMLPLETKSETPVNNENPTVSGGEAAIAEAIGAAVDCRDWRSQLEPNDQQRIVNKIMDTLKGHLPFSGQDGLQELEKIAVRLEEKSYTSATSQSDYLRKISSKMLIMVKESQAPRGNSTSVNKNPTDSASGSMQSQVQNLRQQTSIPVMANQSPVRRQMLSQNIQNNMTSAKLSNSA